MGTIFIIIAIIAIAVAVNFWRNCQKHVTEEPQGQPSYPNESMPGWEIRSIPLGQFVVINGKKFEMRYIALVSDSKPDFNYTYTVDCDFDYMDGRQTITTSGSVGPDITFNANGKTYFGKILAGAPDAKIAEIRKIIVK